MYFPYILFHHLVGLFIFSFLMLISQGAYDYLMFCLFKFLLFGVYFLFSFGCLFIYFFLLFMFFQSLLSFHSNPPLTHY